MLLKPRPYQTEAVDATLAALLAREHPLCKMPTGSGKSIVLALLIDKLYQRSRAPVLVLSHVKELLEQDSKTLRRVNPSLPQSYYCAGLGEKRGGAAAVFASVQSLGRAPGAVGARSYILIDEAHMCPRDSEALYARVFAQHPLALRAGFTATDQRLDSGALCDGDDSWFSSLAFDVPIGTLIDSGYLAPLTGVMTEHQANLAGVSTRMGDFVNGDAERAVMETLSLEETVKEAVQLAAKRRHWLIFAAGVEHAKVILDELKREGIDAGMVLGDTPEAERDKLIDKFREGDLRALVNVGVLTTGFDAPQTDCIISLRPTKSLVLWQQMLGRGMRLADRKENCLLLDFVGNLERLGGAGAVTRIEDHRSGVLKAPIKKGRKRAAEKEGPDFQLASLADPMRERGAFDASVKRVRYFLSPSRRFPGKRLLIASYDLEDEYGRALQSRSFVTVEYPGAARFHAERWFQRRGISDRAQIPRDAQTALALAKVSPEPAEVCTYWDPRMRCYLISDERFATAET